MKNNLPQHLFGTDGIRGVAGQSPLTSQEVHLLGRAAGSVLKSKFPGTPCRVIGVRDTRESSLTLFQALSIGLREQGIDVYDAGVLATPSVAYLVEAHRFQSGFVISASHNAPHFNGIKFFNAHGRKWADEWEREVESLFADGELKKKQISPLGLEIHASQLAEDYESFLFHTLPKDQIFSNFKIALDCSNGANSVLGPQILKKLGAQVFVMANKPNGKNINVHCGSQHTQALAQLVKTKRCDLGVAFDGDGDRVIFIDEKGSEVDGDYIIALLAKYFKSKKLLLNSRVVITVMANLGLKKALSKMGVRIIETPVGDRHVSEAMRQHRVVLGGEQSGHIILGRYLPSGDGLLTALHVLSALKEAGASLSRLTSIMQKFPQVLVNVPVKEKKPIAQLNGVQHKIDEVEKTLNKNGRVFVRYSGTEPLLRIMLEGPDKNKLDMYADEIVREVKSVVN